MSEDGRRGKKETLKLGKYVWEFEKKEEREFEKKDGSEFVKLKMNSK